MAQLAPGTGGPSDAQNGVVEAFNLLDSNVLTDTLQVEAWSYSYQLPIFDSPLEYDFQIYREGVNITEEASYVEAIEVEGSAFGDHGTLLADYRQDVEHVNVVSAAESDIFISEGDAIGQHGTLLADYRQDIEYVNVENSNFNIDVFEAEKKRPNYTWTTSSF